MTDDTEHAPSYPQQSSRVATSRSSPSRPPGADDDHVAGVAGRRQHPVGATAAGNRMKPGSGGIRARRILSAGVAAIAGSFLLLFVPIIVYAFVLAFRARGLPDQAAINHFAAMLSPALMPWLERVLTPVLAFWAARRTEQPRAVDGLAVGFLAAMLGLGVALAFGGRLAVGSVVSSLLLVGLGWLGGVIGQKMSSRS